MKGILGQLLGVVFALIIIYYFFRDGTTTVAFVDALGRNSVESIRVLQGR